MRWFSNLFVRWRPLVGVFLLVVSGLAGWGLVPDRPSWNEMRQAITKLLVGKEAREPPETAATPTTNQPSEAELADFDRWRRDQAVAGSFDMAASQAFLVVKCDDLFRGPSVRTLRAMVRSVESLPVVENVFWVDELPLLNVFGFADPLLPADDAVDESFPQVRQRVLEHPLVRGQTVSLDGRTLIMPVVYNWLYLTGDKDLTDGVVAVAEDAIDNYLATLPEAIERPKIEVAITGSLPLYLTREESFSENHTFYTLLACGLSVVLSIVLLRGVTAVLIVSAAPMLGVFWSIGLLNLLDVRMNEMADVVMPVLVAMIGLTDGVHLLINIRNQRADGASPMEASRWAIEHVGVACFLTSLTTAIGFGSLMLAHSSYVQDFGRACMYGVIITFFAVTTFVPFAASTWLGRSVDRGKENDLVSRSLVSATWLLSALLRRRRLVSALSIAVTVAFGAICCILRPDNRIANDLPSSSSAYQALAFCDEQMGGIQFHRVEIHWPKEVPNDSPRILEAIRDVEAIIAAEPLISHPLSIRNMLAAMPGDPDDLETQMTFLSLLPRELRRFFHQPDNRTATVVTRVQDKGIARYKPVFDRMEQAFNDVAKNYPRFRIVQEGGPVYMARELIQIVEDLVISLGTASLVILVVLTVAYRSIRIGLISIIPNMFPLVATGALLVVIGEPLFISGVCAFTVCLGIAVDDTIHFLSRYRQEIEVDGDVEDAVRRTFVSVGTPMIMTTVILVTGFSTVLLSDLPAHRIFGAMACATIATAVLGDLIALPALLATFDRPRQTGDMGNSKR